MKDKEKENKKEKKISLITVVYSLVLILIFALVFFAVLLYVFNFREGITKKVAGVIPYPAVSLGNSVVTIGKLDKNLESVKMFYAKQDFSEVGMRVDFDTLDGKKRLKIKEKYLLEKLIENKIIEQEAQARDIKLTKEIVSQEVRRKMDQYGSNESVLRDLRNLYGWDISDFEENVVKPDIYKEKLLAYLRENDKSYAEAKEKISLAKKELGEGTDFKNTVKKYSEGESAKNGGDLGWFSPEEMLSEISAEAFSMDKGKISDIIETPLGYHIIKLDDRKKEGEDEKVKVSQIFVRTKGIGDWISEYEKNVSIQVFLKDFYWDKKETRVQFSDKDMIEFEKKMEEDSGGDVSIMF